VEPYDFRASVKCLWRGELPVNAWLRSFIGRREFAWFSRDDPLPFLMLWVRLAIRGVAKIVRIGLFKSRGAAIRWTGVGQKGKRDQKSPIT
jgi:hypothetical protein